MTGDLPQPALILFAKSPLSGRVKTRLMPELSADEAAQVAAVLVRTTVQQAAQNWPGPVSICVWPDHNHPLFASLAAQFLLTLSTQSNGDLGQKMFNALRMHTDQGLPAAILGCDVPQLPGGELRRAYELLQHGRNVIGPSRDGGYYLIGLQQTHPEVFKNVGWGGGGVMRQTMDAADRCGVHFHRLLEMVDVDSYQDLVIAAETVPELDYWVKKI